MVFPVGSFCLKYANQKTVPLLLQLGISISNEWRIAQGSEAGIMAAAHCTSRQNADTHKHRTSVASWYIKIFVRGFFKEMIDEVILEPVKNFYVHCVWSYFSELMQMELDNFVER